MSLLKDSILFSQFVGRQKRKISSCSGGERKILKKKNVNFSLIKVASTLSVVAGGVAAHVQ
jgi:hypothetical protein